MDGLRERAEGADEAVDRPFLRANRDRLDRLSRLGHCGRDSLNAATLSARGRDMRGDGRDFCFSLLNVELISFNFRNGLL